MDEPTDIYEVRDPATGQVHWNKRTLRYGPRGRCLTEGLASCAADGAAILTANLTDVTPMNECTYERPVREETADDSWGGVVAHKVMHARGVACTEVMLP